MMVFIIFTECPNCGKEITGTDADIVVNGKVVGKTENMKVTTACSWCKAMEKRTFKDSAFVEYINQTFYPVMLDISSEDSIEVNGHVFVPVQLEKPLGNGMTRVHQLFLALAKNQRGYPNTILMNEKVERIMERTGYIGEPDLRMMLEFAEQEKYKEMDFDSFKKAKREN